MNQKDRGVLLRNYMTLITTLSNQEYICCYLRANGIVTTEDVESVLLKQVNISRNRCLLELVEKRFKYAFPLFCDALEQTNQITLLEVLKEEVAIKVGAYGECKMCRVEEANIIFLPCGHVCSCVHSR